MQLQGGIGGACGSFHSFAAACIKALLGRRDDVVTMGVVLSGRKSAEMLQSCFADASQRHPHQRAPGGRVVGPSKWRLSGTGWK